MTYGPYAGRRRDGRALRRRALKITVIVLLFGSYLVGAGIWFAQHIGPKMGPQAAETVKTADPVATAAAADALQQANDQRKADAYALTYAAGDYYLANNQAYPAGFAAGKLIGGANSKPQPVTLTHYKTVAVVTGAQPPVATDTIRLVGQAACAQSLSATVASTLSYAYVVQYAQQTSDGSYSAVCLKL